MIIILRIAAGNFWVSLLILLASMLGFTTSFESFGWSAWVALIVLIGLMPRLFFPIEDLPEDLYHLDYYD